MPYLWQIMKKHLKRFFIYSIAFSIFISGNGVVLAMHTCLASAVKNVSLFQESTCCSKKDRKCNTGCHNQKESLASKCCSVEVSYHKINAPFLTQKTLEPPVLNFINTSFFTLNNLVKGQFFFNHFIPPDISFSLPIVHHQLLI